MSRRRDDRSREADEYRKLYSLAAWRGPNGRRKAQLRAQPFCEMCLIRGEVRAATVADHIEPHRGEYDLFMTGALMSLCDTDHSSTKQRIEKGGAGYSSAAGLDGWPTDPNHPANKRR